MKYRKYKYLKWAIIASGIAGLTISTHAKTYNGPEVAQTTPPGNPSYAAPPQPQTQTQMTPQTQTRSQGVPQSQPYTGTPQEQAYTNTEQEESAPPSNEEKHLYHGNELSLDLFGVGTLHEPYINSMGDRARHNTGNWGGGVGVNYFLGQHLGVGGDFYALSFKRSFVDVTTGNLIFRFPIGDTGLAPYVFGGAGYQFNGIDQIVAGGGGGIEYRCCEHIGVFVDVRWLAGVKTQSFGVGRAGIRLSF